MNVLAPACGSWSQMSRGTSLRSPVNPFGRQALQYVRDGSMVLSRSCMGLCTHACVSCTSQTLHPNPSKPQAQPGRRMVLLLLLIMAVHAVFLIEQPRGSDDVFPHHPRFAWFTNCICWAPWSWLKGTIVLSIFPQYSLKCVPIVISQITPKPEHSSTISFNKFLRPGPQSILVEFLACQAF